MALLVSTTINGDHVEFACEPDETLLDALRNRVGLTGVKEGCGTGDCGAHGVQIEIGSAALLITWSMATVTMKDSRNQFAT